LRTSWTYSIRNFKWRPILLAALFFISGCSTFNSLAARWFDEPDLRNSPEAKYDPQTGELLQGGVI
jgi:hypothetical protein